MKIDEVMWRFQQRAVQEARENGEPEPEVPPIAFDRLQELVQKGQLDPAEMALLSHLLGEVEAWHPSEAAGGSTRAVAARTALVSAARQLQANQREAAVSARTRERRIYAPGPPVPTIADGPVRPLHPRFLNEDLAAKESGEDSGAS